jgi:ABC-2 type transport system ATP-binding protein
MDQDRSIKKPVIQVTNLNKTYLLTQKDPGLMGSIRSLFHRSYTSVSAVNNVSFSINPGELVGFIGPNGAGKTTTLKMLSGLLYPTSGQIDVLGFNPFNRKDEFLRQISLVMGQKNQLWWDLPAMDTFLMNQQIYGISKQQFQATLDELVSLLDVSKQLKTQVRKLSLGQRMKMELIAALIHRPKILFLDEPTIGLDVVMQANLREFIKEYNKKYNATIILTSHYMDDVKSLCKRVIIIDHGTIIYDGLLAKLVSEYSHHKYITVELEERVDKDKLTSFGNLHSFEFPKAIYKVRRTDATAFVAKLINDLPIADVNIEEPEIEDIIRDVFTKSRG